MKFGPVEIEAPRWDGKLVLAGIFIIGYYALVLLMATRPLPATNAGLVRDALLTLGPPIGLIFGALFRNTAAEERREAMRSSELQTAITTPSVVGTGEQLGDQVEDGARTGTREGITQTLTGAGASSSGGSEATPPPVAGIDYDPSDDIDFTASDTPERAKWA